MSDRTAFLYRWTHVPTGMWYVGSRTAMGCHPEDGYICSSKTVRPMIAENKNDWFREILAIADPKYILHLETRYLQSVDAKNDPMSFNRHNSDGIFVSFGDDNPMRNPEISKKLGDANRGENNWRRKRPPEYISPQIGQKRPSITGDKHPNKNPINAAKISRSHSGKKHPYQEGEKNVMRRPEVAAKISGENHWMNKITKCVCEHCGIQVAKSNYTRWHGKNCKRNIV